MVRRGSSRVSVVLASALGVSAGFSSAGFSSAEEPAPVVLALPPLAVPAPPADVRPAPDTTTPPSSPPALESLPPLSSPIAVPVAPAPVAAAPVLEIPPDRRPVLAVPGLPTPRAASTPAAPPAESGVLRLPTGRQDAVDRPSGIQPGPTSSRDTELAGTVQAPLPEADGPPLMVPSNGAGDPLSAEGPPPLVPPGGAEAIPEGRPRLERPATRYASDPAQPFPLLEPPRGGSLDPPPSTRRNPPNTVDAGIVGSPPEEARAPSRRRLFGLFRRADHAPDVPPPSPVVAGEPTRIKPQDGETIQVEPRSDPAADTALKRRLEAQIQSALGNQLKALDVRVVDRTVYVRAAVTRFWQKRSVRRTLETLPALAGYRTRIEVID